VSFVERSIIWDVGEKTVLQSCGMLILYSSASYIECKTNCLINNKLKIK